MFEKRIAELNGTVKAKRTYTVAEICEILGVGRVSVYNLIKERAFKAVLVVPANEVLKTAVEISRKELGTVISSSSLDACNINAL
mgnify:CR=1 FL=1